MDCSFASNISIIQKIFLQYIDHLDIWMVEGKEISVYKCES